MTKRVACLCLAVSADLLCLSGLLADEICKSATQKADSALTSVNSTSRHIRSRAPFAGDSGKSVLRKVLNAVSECDTLSFRAEGDITARPGAGEPGRRFHLAAVCAFDLSNTESPHRRVSIELPLGRNRMTIVLNIEKSDIYILLSADTRSPSGYRLSIDDLKKLSAVRHNESTSRNVGLLGDYGAALTEGRPLAGILRRVTAGASVLFLRPNTLTISSRDETRGKARLYFDPDTRLPQRLLFDIPARGISADIEFSDWKTKGAVDAGMPAVPGFYTQFDPGRFVNAAKNAQCRAPALNRAEGGDPMDIVDMPMLHTPEGREQFKKLRRMMTRFKAPEVLKTLPERMRRLRKMQHELMLRMQSIDGMDLSTSNPEKFIEGMEQRSRLLKKSLKSLEEIKDFFDDAQGEQMCEQLSKACRLYREAVDAARKSLHSSAIASGTTSPAAVPVEGDGASPAAVPVEGDGASPAGSRGR